MPIVGAVFLVIVVAAILGGKPKPTCPEGTARVAPDDRTGWICVRYEQ